MTVLEVIKLVAQYIGDPDLLDTTTLGGEVEPTSQQTNKINMLISCINDTAQSLAIMYFPLKKEEIVSSSNGCYQFSQFTKPLLDILKIVDNRLKFNVEFAMFPDHFEAKAGDLLVNYTYLPSETTTLSSKIEVVENKVTARMLAIGVTSRYYLMVGMYQDANNWNEMFERAILIAQRRKDNIVLKKRRWL